MATSPEQELQEELVKLRLATVRRLRERLEDPNETATPSYLDVARKLVADLMVQAAPERVRPVVENLPFPGDEA